MNVWTFQLCLNFNLLLTMTTRPSAVFTLKGASSFRQPTSFVCIRAQPIPISLARIRHLHNEGWMEDSSAGLSLYKPFFLCSPQHNLGCSLSLCPGLQSLLAQINSFYSLLQPKYIFFFTSYYIFSVFEAASG